MFVLVMFCTLAKTVRNNYATLLYVSLKGKIMLYVREIFRKKLRLMIIYVRNFKGVGAKYY